jgi:hypothetical protein
MTLFSLLTTLVPSAFDDLGGAFDSLGLPTTAFLLCRYLWISLRQMG